MTLLLLLIAAAGLGACGSSAPGPVETTSRVPAPEHGEGVSWKYFGRIAERTHYLPANLKPPFEKKWEFDAHALIEFPPAYANGILYVTNQYGDLRALRASDGKTVWDLFDKHRTVGPPIDVTGPAYSRGRVYVARKDGLLLSVDAETGEVIWKRHLPAGLESSPLVIGNRLFIGTDKGELLALNTARRGKTIWSYKRPFPIRASASSDRGVIYGADYGGSMFALRASNGKQIWRTDTSSPGFPPGGSGGFYSSPALDNGLVYAGRDDGTVYALTQRSGKLKWNFAVHAFLYGSPAVADVPGKPPPSVYIGSYDGFLHVVNALTGHQLWQAHTGPVPGTADVIGHIVYTSSFKFQKAIGIDIRTHKQVFSFPTAGYTPMISNGKSLFLVGYFDLARLVPKK